MKQFLVVVALLGCGSKPAAPVTTVPPVATTPIEVPVIAEGVTLQLMCEPIVVDDETPVAIPLNITASHIGKCSKSPSTGVLSFQARTNADSTGDVAYLALASFNGNGTYDLDAVQPEKVYFDGEHGGRTVRGQSVHSRTKGRTCAPKCRVFVNEQPARQNERKTYEFKASCDSLCVADQYICRNGQQPIQFKLTADCENT